MKRYWIEEAEEFFEDWPEPDFNKMTELNIVLETRHTNGDWPYSEFPLGITLLEIVDESS